MLCKNAAGSHCLLMLEQGQEVDDIYIQYAADVASYHSQCREDTKVSVTYCSPKYLRRPQGIRKLGLVSLASGWSTVFGRPSRGKLLVDLFGPKDLII